MSDKVMWYYKRQNGRAGPVEESEIALLITQGVIGSSTLVWKEGMDNWGEAYSSDLAKYFLGNKSYEPIPSSNSGGFFSQIKLYFGSSIDLPKKLRTWFLIFGVSLCLSIMLSALGPIAWLATIASSFFGLLIMYHAWSRIPEEKRPTSPLVMVLLMIVPLFNLVWIFICYYGLSKKLNAELRSKGVDRIKVNQTAALGYCLSSVLMTVLFVVSFMTGTMIESAVLILVIAIVATQIFLMKSIVIAIVKLL